MALAAVPTGSKPTVLRHKRITVVLCNQEQIDETYCTDSALYVGVGGLAEDGTPLPGRASASAWTIDADGAIEKVKVDAPRARLIRGACRCLLAPAL